MNRYRVSADIGGTFTDIVVEPSNATAFVGKVSTTPENPARGVIDGIKDLIPDLSEIDFFVHGTTVALNAFLERKGERVLLITTAGTRDSYTIARGNRHSLYNLHYQKPEQLVPRHDVHEVRGRLAWNGDIIEPLNHSDFEPIIKKVVDEGINAIAVCLLHAYAYSQHELEAYNILSKALTNVSISLSHTIASEWREYERASSTVMNAYIAPVVENYLSTLQHELLDQKMQSTIHIMQSSGGVTTANNARKKPIYTLLSGPVGGTIAGTALSAKTGRPNLLCIDMGGTSFDLSLVINGKANTTLETELEGLPLLMPVIDIQTIGTGGGSVAWMDNGALRVGPHSAGSLPGPACYGRGGTEPTVTDANLFLGRLGSRSLLSGDILLDKMAAKKAIERLASEAGLEPVTLAEGILAISNAAMADAMRTTTVSQGLDPRKFTLVTFGGAGPMAAAFLAEELEIEEVLIPRFPGAFSAYGMLQTDLRYDFTKSFFRTEDSVTVTELENTYAILKSEGLDTFLKEGVTKKNIFYQRSADMRYTGQEYTINVSVPSTINMTDTVTDFHTAHQQRYGHSNANAAIEFVNLRVAAFGALSKYSQLSKLESQTKNPTIGERQTTFNGINHKTQILHRDSFTTSFQASGPLIIEEQSATTVVPPDWQIKIDPQGSIIMRRRTK